MVILYLYVTMVKIVKKPGIDQPPPYWRLTGLSCVWLMIRMLSAGLIQTG